MIRIPMIVVIFDTPTRAWNPDADAREVVIAVLSVLITWIFVFWYTRNPKHQGHS